MPLHIHHRLRRGALPALACALILAGCGSAPGAPSASAAKPTSSAKAGSSRVPGLPPAGSGRGGYYQDDGPGDAPPEGLLDVPDAVPRIEPYSARGNRPYVVFGKTYTPITEDKPFKQRGVGSWYGKKFHGQKTSSGELYDMYKMTAAHPTLPIPSYARVTNLANGRQVIVRVNDRGPFLSNRIIDLSYTAALKLGYLGKGSSELEVERLLPEDIVRMENDRKAQQARADSSMPAQPVAQTGAAEPAVAVAVSNAPAPERVPEPDSTMAMRSTPDDVAPNAVPNTAPDVASAKTVVLTSAPAVAFSSVAPGFYLQLGSYAQAANAEAARSHLMQNWATGLPPVEVAGEGAFHRLFSGPYASRAEATAAAQVLRRSGTSRPIVVQR